MSDTQDNHMIISDGEEDIADVMDRRDRKERSPSADVAQQKNEASGEGTDEHQGRQREHPHGKEEPRFPPVDREKTCPFLLRIFCQEGRHRSVSEYTDRLPSTRDEFHVHTWMDASVRELVHLIKAAFPPSRHPGARISLRVVFQHPQSGRMQIKDLGTFTGGRFRSEQRTVAGRQLRDFKFTIGDYLDVAVFGTTTSRTVGESRRPSSSSGYGRIRR